MAHRSQSSSVGDNPHDPNYLPPHYREEYRLAIDALIENDIKGYYEYLQSAGVVSFLAPPEIEFIKSTIQTPIRTSSMPELMYHEPGQAVDGSSDTYWPMQTEIAAPGLDLGWPLPQHSFVGPTEVTTLVNPSDPDMPSIKEQARRIIKNARQVVAVVMDMFTDVDIFADLLEAASRQIPVYIILDEQDSCHFVSMVLNCKVNLEQVPMMRVRTVPGITYQSKTGQSFKGQMKDRFLLADCRAVLSGNYSFMWSYEKIHRCIAHLFLGELVSTFDEEFRILFAQSEPLVIGSSDRHLALSDTSSTSSYFSGQYGMKRSQSMRNPIGYRRPHELQSTFPFGDSERNLGLQFRRTDPFRQTIETGPGISIGKYSQQQFRLQQSYLEQGKSIVSRQMEMSASGFQRHSYAEGTQETYASSRQFMKHRVMNNLDETDFHRDQIHGSHFYNEDSSSGHRDYERLRGRRPHLAIDQYSESSFRSDQDVPPANYGRDHFSSEDLKGPEGHRAHPLAGMYGGGHSSKRPSLSQTYACQSSPTQPHAPEKKHFNKPSDQEHEEDADAKQGMRTWRIHSYLSTYEDGGEEGLAQPMGADAFEDPPTSRPPSGTGDSSQLTKLKEPPGVPPKPRPDIMKPRFGKPMLSESTSNNSGPTNPTDKSAGKVKRLVQEKREKEHDKGTEKEAGSGTREVGVDVEMKETPDLFLSKHESFRSRVNPLLQRSSRLRSSLIFATSTAEVHTSGVGLKPATEEDEELNSVRTSSIVTQILEKRRSLSREPYEWKKMLEEKEKDKWEENKEREKEKQEKEQKQEEKETKLKNELKAKKEPEKAVNDIKVEKTVDEKQESANMNDPANRLQYFKELADKRKASRMATEASLKALEPAEKKVDLSNKPQPNPVTTPNASTVSGKPAESEPKKLDIAAKIAELTRRSSVSSKPPTGPSIKPPLSLLKPSETSQSQKEETATEGQKKDILKSLKPLASPKIFRKDPIKIKGFNPRRSCGEEILTTDATDAEKSEMKKSRSYSSSVMPREDSKEGLPKFMGSNTSLNTQGEGKTLDFLKKHTQKLRGILGPKDKERKSQGDDRAVNPVIEITDDAHKKRSSAAKDAGSSSTDQTTTNSKTSTSLSGPSRYQSPASSVLFSSNLRDDTKVILEQISANSQKNRLEREEPAGENDSDASEKSIEKQVSLKRNKFLRPQGNTLEREGLLKRIESMRKEKKVYSRFEMGNNLG